MEAAVLTFCKSLNISGMQTFVRLQTEFYNLLLNAAGYFDISPNYLGVLVTDGELVLFNNNGVHQPWQFKAFTPDGMIVLVVVGYSNQLEIFLLYFQKIYEKL